jgi:hypothetical protein
MAHVVDQKEILSSFGLSKIEILRYVLLISIPRFAESLLNVNRVAAPILIASDGDHV